MAAKKDDLGADEVQSIRDEAREKGYEGSVPPQPDNSAFSLQSGPDSPSAGEQAVAAAEQAAADAKASLAESKKGS